MDPGGQIRHICQQVVWETYQASVRADQAEKAAAERAAGRAEAEALAELEAEAG